MVERRSDVGRPRHHPLRHATRSSRRFSSSLSLSLGALESLLMQAGRASTRLVQPRALTPSARLHTLSLTCVRVHKTIPRQLTLSIASLAPLPTACHACVCVLGIVILNDPLPLCPLHSRRVIIPKGPVRSGASFARSGRMRHLVAQSLSRPLLGRVGGQRGYVESTCPPSQRAHAQQRALARSDA